MTTQVYLPTKANPKAPGANPDEIKGRMTLADISKAYNVPVAEILSAFEATLVE